MRKPFNQIDPKQVMANISISLPNDVIKRPVVAVENPGSGAQRMDHDMFCDDMSTCSF